MHFRELIDNGNFSSRQEINCIKELLNKDDYFDGSISDLFDKNFIKIPNKDPFTSLNQLLEYLFNQSPNDEEALILLCEVLLTFIYEYEHSINSKNFRTEVTSLQSVPEENLKYLKRYIYEVVERIHHKVIPKSNNDFIIVPQDKKSTQAAEIVSCNDKDIAIKILEYKHFSTTVDDKEKILISIAKYMEDKRVELTESLKEDNLYIQRNNKIVLVDQMFEMINTLHNRHNNKKQYIKESQREQWYDNTYNTILTVIIIDEQAKINKEFKRLKEENRKNKYLVFYKSPRI